tara:strand:+ start:277 stop:483 length:207 start_codon:yes stop_codon:yes gene_type:complete
MEQITEPIGNPIVLLIERIFWLGLGGFLGLAIITSIIRRDKDKITKPVSPEELKKLAEKATLKNREIN